MGSLLFQIPSPEWYIVINDCGFPHSVVPWVLSLALTLRKRGIPLSGSAQHKPLAL